MPQRIGIHLMMMFIAGSALALLTALAPPATVGGTVKSVSADGKEITVVIGGGKSGKEQAFRLTGSTKITLDGKPVKGASDLRNRVSLTQFGTDVTVTVIRDGKKRDIKLTLGKMPKEEEVAEVEERPSLQGAQFSDDDAEDKGVIVAEVQRNSPAWISGLRAKDVIGAINRKPVKSVEDLHKALKDGRQAALSVQRGDENLFLIIR